MYYEAFLHTHEKRHQMVAEWKVCGAEVTRYSPEMLCVHLMHRVHLVYCVHHQASTVHLHVFGVFFFRIDCNCSCVFVHRAKFCTVAHEGNANEFTKERNISLKRQKKNGDEGEIFKLRQKILQRETFLKQAKNLECGQSIFKAGELF